LYWKKIEDSRDLLSHTAATFRWRYDEFQKLRSGEKMKLDVLGIASTVVNYKVGHEKQVSVYRR